MLFAQHITAQNPVPQNLATQNLATQNLAAQDVSTQGSALARDRRMLAVGIHLLMSLALLGLASITAAGEVPFSSAQTVGALGDADAVVLGDMDGDGDLDIVSADRSIEGIDWWENTAGDGSAWTKTTVINFFFGGYDDVAVADIDGDGDLDIGGATVNVSGSFLEWAENAAGDGSAWTQRTVGNGFGDPLGIDLGDVDGDGDVDAVGAGCCGVNGVRLYENNNGAGTSWTLSAISSNDATSVTLADMDGDGDLDALASYLSGNEVSWWENTVGDGSAWTERPVSTSRTDAESAEPGDVDGDGDLDVIFASPTDGILAWAENTAGDGTVWFEQLLDLNADTPVDVRPADLDMDGDLDLVVVEADAFTVFWWENLSGSGTSWSRHTIENSMGEGRAVFVGDIDGDGDPDLLGTDHSGGQLVWWENLTLHRSAAFPAQTTIDSNFTGVEDLDTGDIDGDGDVDLLAVASGEDVAWWENTAGDGTAWTQSEVAEMLKGRSVRLADLDRDGDLDALLASDRGVAWVENTAGDGTAWTLSAIDGTLPGAMDVDAADIDGDGDLDVAATDGDEDDVLWFENTSGDGTAWSINTVDLSFAGAGPIEAVDLDGDGDPDIVAGAGAANEVAWWENTAGDGSTWTKRTVAAAFGTVDSVTTEDLDGDGDLDVLGAADSLSRVAWFENTAGDGTAWTTMTLDNGFSGARHAVAADLDDDGDLDVLGAGTGDGAVWWENTAGDGATWAAGSLDSSFVGATRLRAADVDGDGDLDPLGAAFSGDDLVWWPNRGGQFALPTIDAVTQSMPGEGTADVLLQRIEASHRGRAGDGDLELVTFELLFEEAPGDPLSDSELGDLVSVLRIYHDDGDGSFETDGSDVNFHSVAAPFSLSSGVLSATFVDGESDVQVSFGADETYFVALDLKADASDAAVTTLRLTHLTSSSSTAEMSSTDIPLTLEAQSDTASTITIVARPEIAVSPTFFNFGDQPTDAGASAAQTFTFNNTGGADLSITSVTLMGSDAGDFAITADSGESVLAPGAERTVDIAFDPSTAGPKIAGLRIISNDPDNGTFDVPLTGTGTEPEISVSAGSLVFGDQSITAGGAVQSLTITNDGNADLSISSVTVSGLDVGEFAITADSGETVLAPAAVRTLEIAFDPTSLGAKTAILTIVSDDGDEPTTEIGLSGTGTAAEVTLSPTAVDFGDQSIVGGASSPRTVELTNDGVVDLVITSVSLVGTDVGDFAIDSDDGATPLGTGAKRTVTVVFDPSSVGLKSAALRFQFDDGASVEVGVGGTGTTPDLAVSPAPFDFGGWSITASTPAEQTFTLTNQGDANLSITSVRITGLDATELTITDDSGEAILLPGETRTVDVAFSPDTAGAKAAVLRVASDDPDAPTFDVAISGSGTEPEITIAPLLIDFGEQDVDGGASSAQAVSITNDGSGPLVIASVVIAGADMTDFSIASDSGEAILGPAETRIVSLVFDPSEEGVKAATLRVISDDFDEPVLGVALDGTGGSSGIDTIFADGFESGDTTAWSLTLP